MRREARALSSSLLVSDVGGGGSGGEGGDEVVEVEERNSTEVEVVRVEFQEEVVVELR